MVHLLRTAVVQLCFWSSAAASPVLGRDGNEAGKINMLKVHRSSAAWSLLYVVCSSRKLAPAGGSARTSAGSFI